MLIWGDDHKPDVCTRDYLVETLKEDLQAAIDHRALVLAENKWLRARNAILQERLDRLIKGDAA